jgi:hypothetical protein
VKEHAPGFFPRSICMVLRTKKAAGSFSLLPARNGVKKGSFFSNAFSGGMKVPAPPDFCFEILLPARNGAKEVFSFETLPQRGIKFLAPPDFCLEILLLPEMVR